VDCPRCGHRQIFQGSAECERCGVIFARLPQEAVSGTAPPAAPEPSTAAPDAGRACIDAQGWRALAIGAGLAVATQLVPLLGVLVGYFVVLAHELGHTLAGWAFGRPSLPALDFLYGGGVTAYLDTSKALLVLIYAVLACGAWVFRRNRASLSMVAGFAVLHALLVWSGGDRAVITAMGHGTELLIAGLFVHRAVSGRGCTLAAERPLYAWIGLHIVLHDLGFAWGLMTSDRAREIYANAKGGGHWMDFDVLANQVLHVPLEAVAALFFAACLATPLVPLLAHRQRPRVERALGRLARVV
jgi:hypothetical protein